MAVQNSLMYIIDAVMATSLFGVSYRAKDRPSFQIHSRGGGTPFYRCIVRALIEIRTIHASRTCIIDSALS